MGKYIDKDALIAEIERRKEKCDTFYDIALSNNAELAKVVIEEQKRQHNSLLSFINTLEVKEVNLDEEVDKNDYRKLFEDSTKLNIDSTTEIKFDESTKFKWDDYIKMKEEKTITSKFYKRLFKNIPTVSMKIFSWWNRNIRERRINYDNNKRANKKCSKTSC